jgi:hypothetical protein
MLTYVRWATGGKYPRGAGVAVPRDLGRPPFARVRIQGRFIYTLGQSRAQQCTEYLRKLGE